MDVYLSESKMHGPRRWVYQVWVDGKIVDTFTSTRWLTHAEQVDVAAGYREGLDGYTPASAAA